MKTIAIIPAPEWREALLGDGPCGSRAPIIQEPSPSMAWLPGGRTNPADIGRPYPRVALPLLWRGEPVPDGIARAVRAQETYQRWTPGGGCCHHNTTALQGLARDLLASGIAAEIVTEEGP